MRVRGSVFHKLDIKDNLSLAARESSFIHPERSQISNSISARNKFESSRRKHSTEEIIFETEDLKSNYSYDEFWTKSLEYFNKTVTADGANFSDLRNWWMANL